MTENMRKFIENISANNELAEKIGSMTKDELIVLANGMDLELTEADFAQASSELSDDELDAVAGGGVCACVMGGGGTSDGSNTSNLSDAVCACVLGGSGKNKGGYTRCVCVMGGGGNSVICGCVGGGIG